MAQVDPNYQHPEYMCSPLVACTLAGQYDAAALLLQYGADPQLRSEGEVMTPLQAACHRRDPALIRLIDLSMKVGHYTTAFARRWTAYQGD